MIIIMFLQVHMLASYPPSLLNRDDVGLAKRIHFGDSIRLRVSSQSLKRHWRMALRNDWDEEQKGYRTRYFFEHLFRDLQEDDELKDLEVNKIEKAISELYVAIGLSSNNDTSNSAAADKNISENKTQEAKKPSKKKWQETQLILWNNKEKKSLYNYLKKIILEDGVVNVKDVTNLLSLTKRNGSMDDAIFGRMVTSNVLNNTDSPLYVAHALTVHAAETEFDFFTGLDDLPLEHQTGAGMIDSTELGSGIFYIYFVLNLDQLKQNLKNLDDDVSTEDVSKRLIQIAAKTSIGAKLGSTAPFTYASTVLLELTKEQPCSLANAFMSSVRCRPNEDSSAKATDFLLKEFDDLNQMYNRKSVWCGVLSRHEVSSSKKLLKYKNMNELLDGFKEKYRED